MRAAVVCGIFLMVLPACGVSQAPASAGSAAAQQRTQRDGPAIRKTGCPAVAPPSTSSSAATASDWIELKRTTCYGSCPAYTVRVRGDGAVLWHGDASVVVLNSAASAIDSGAARALIQRVADRGFWGLCSRYERGITDSATYTTTISIAGHVKRVEDYAESAPSWLREEDFDIDRVADTHQWRHGGPTVETFGDDRLLVDANAPKAGVTQLMRAAVLPDTGELVRILKLLGDVNEQDSSGATAMMYAAQAGPVEAMSLLLQAGADANAKTDEGETPLFAAVSARVRGEDRVRLLNAAGIDVNERDGRGMTPLMVACKGSWQPRVVSALMELGADPSKRDDQGRKAIDYLDRREALVADVAGYGVMRGLLLPK